MQHFDHILESLATRTQRVFDTALGAERYQLLTRRLYQLYGALELARLANGRGSGQKSQDQDSLCKSHARFSSSLAPRVIVRYAAATINWNSPAPARSMCLRGRASRKTKI